MPVRRRIPPTSAAMLATWGNRTARRNRVDRGARWGAFSKRASHARQAHNRRQTDCALKRINRSQARPADRAPPIPQPNKQWCGLSGWHSRPSPSPQPSPSGRGSPVRPPPNIGMLWCFGKLPLLPPLLWGEGRGEGEQDHRPPTRLRLYGSLSVVRPPEGATGGSRPTSTPANSTPQNQGVPVEFAGGGVAAGG